MFFDQYPVKILIDRRKGNHYLKMQKHYYSEIKKIFWYRFVTYPINRCSALLPSLFLSGICLHQPAVNRNSLIWDFYHDICAFLY